MVVVVAGRCLSSGCWKHAVLKRRVRAPGRCCRRACTIEKNLLKNPRTEPQSFCRILGAKPSFSDPANSPPNIQDVGEGGLSLMGVADMTETAITAETVKTIMVASCPCTV